MAIRMRHLTHAAYAEQIVRTRTMYGQNPDPLGGDSCANFLVGFNNVDQALHSGACMHFVWTGGVVQAAYPSGNGADLHQEGVWRYAVPPGADMAHLVLVGIRFEDDALDELIGMPRWWGWLTTLPVTGNLLRERLARWRSARRDERRAAVRRQLPCGIQVALRPRWLERS